MTVGAKLVVRQSPQIIQMVNGATQQHHPLVSYVVAGGGGGGGGGQSVSSGLNGYPALSGHCLWTIWSIWRFRFYWKFWL